MAVAASDSLLQQQETLPVVSAAEAAMDVSVFESVPNEALQALIAQQQQVQAQILAMQASSNGSSSGPAQPAQPNAQLVQNLEVQQVTVQVLAHQPNLPQV